MLSSLRRLVGILLAILIVASAVPALILFNVEGHAFEAVTYERALDHTDFYQQFPIVLADLVQQNLGTGAPAFLQRITSDQWQAIMATLLPEQQLQSMAKDAITQGFAFLNGEAPQPVISLSPLKESLGGPAGMQAALFILQAQPPCTAEQAAKMLYSLGNEICNPPQELVDLVRPVLQAELQSVAASLPDHVALGSGPTDLQLQSALKDLRLGRLLMRISPLLPLLLLLALTLVAVRTLPSWLAWWGWPMLLTGLLGLPASLLAGPLLAPFLERLFQRSLAQAMPPVISNAISSVLAEILNEILRPAIAQSMVLLAVGALMVLASTLARRTSAADLADTQPTARRS